MAALSEDLELVRAAPGVTEAAGTARIEIQDARGMRLAGLIEFAARRGRLEGSVDHRLLPEMPADLGESLSSQGLGPAGPAMAGMLQQMGAAMESLRAVQPPIAYVLDDGRLYPLAGHRWLGGARGLEAFGGPPPWQDDPLWVLDLLRGATAARELEEPREIHGEGCRRYAVDADVIAAAEDVDRPMRLPSATLTTLRAFPAEVWLDGDGRIRRLTCGPPPATPGL